MRKNMTLKKTMAILLAAGVFITSIPVESISAEPADFYDIGYDVYEEAAYVEPTPAEPMSSYEEPTSVEITYIEPTSEEPVYQDPSSYVEPTYVEPTYVEPAYVEPTYVEPTYQDPTYVEPASAEPVYETATLAEPVYYEEPTTAQPTSTFFLYEDDLLKVEVTLYEKDALPADTRLIVKQISPEDPELFEDEEYLRWETEDQKKDRLLYEWTDRMLTESLEDQELYAVDSLIYDLYFEQNGERLMPEGPFRVYFEYKEEKVLNEDADQDNVRFLYLDDNEITRKVDAVDTRADLKVDEKGSVKTAEFYIGRYRHTPLVVSMLETKGEHEKRLKEEAEAESESVAAIEVEPGEETAPEPETTVEEMTEVETEPATEPESETEPETSVAGATKAETEELTEEQQTEEETEATVEDKTQEDASDEDDREGDPVRTYYTNWNGDVSVTIILSNPAQVPDTAEVEVTAVTSDTVGSDYDAYMEALNNSSDTTEYTAENTLLYDIRFVDTILDENGEEQQIEYEPAEGSVRVVLRFNQNQLSDEINAEADENVEVNHLVVDAAAETAQISAADISVELVEANVKLEGTDTVSFQTESFSVYAFTYTVDFHWGEYTWSITGKSDILLSELFEKLGVTEITPAQVADVSFSNPDYLEIRQTASDWLLTSLAPFGTDETLTLILLNGQSVQITVTDDQVTITAKVGLIYDGRDQELVAVSGGENETLSFALGDNNETAPEDATDEETRWSTSIPKGENAGTYYVWYKASGNEPKCILVTIAQRSVTITAGSAEKVYDGTALSIETYTSRPNSTQDDGTTAPDEGDQTTDDEANEDASVQDTGLAAGDHIDSVIVTGSQKDVGSSDNVPSVAVIKNAKDEDVTANYDITYVNGTLKVTPKPVTVTANDDHKYLKAVDPEFTATVVGLLGDDTVTYTVSRVQGEEEVGEYAITPSGEENQGNYVVTYVPGKLTITGIKVVWKNGDKVLKEDTNVAYGSKPVYDGAEPTKEEEGHKWVFSRWEPEITEETTITGDVTFNAVFVEMFEINWLDGDGNTLLTEWVKQGEMPAYTGKTPPKAKTAQYTYTFNGGWEPEIVPVNGAASYMATFDKEVNKYTVTWKNGDEVLKTDTVEYGMIPTYDGEDPEKAPDGNAPLYGFIGWEPKPAPIEGDITYTAQFAGAVVGLHIYDKDSAASQGISGAVFTLTNSEGIVVWQGTTGANGNLYIEELNPEPTESRKEDGGGASFEVGSTYTLTQIATDDDHFCPQGYWTLKVSEKSNGGKTNKDFAVTAVKGSELDLSTIQPEQFGISFYIPNELAAKLTYTTTNPDGTVVNSETEKLDFLSYGGDYTITKDDLVDSTGNYEFVGWEDANHSVWKKGDTLTLNTVSIKDYTLTSAWRIPLNLSVYTYSGGNIASAELVEGSKGIFPLGEEKTLTYSTMKALGQAYDNAEAQAITKSDAYDLTLAKITNDSDSDTDVSVTAMRYDSGAHAWQYRDSSNQWRDLAVGDKLSLYYTSNTLKVVWLKDEGGSLSPLDEGQFPSKFFTIGSDRWYTPDDLFGSEQAKLESIVEGDFYFQYYIMGTDHLNSVDAGLARSTDFQLMNSDQGFQYLAGAAGTPENLPELTTVYLVYAETPPTGSTRMDIENLTESKFRIRELQVANADILSTHRAIIETDEGLKIFDGVTTWTEGKHAAHTLDENTTARLVLLDAAGKSYTLDGVFETNPGSVSYGIGSVDKGTIQRGMLSEYQITQTTRSLTMGTLDSYEGKTILSFSDVPEGTFTVNKVWSEDVNKSIMRVTFDLYEIGLGTASDWPDSIPLADEASEETVLNALRTQGYTVLKVSRGGDSYTITQSNGWSRTYSTLPPSTDRQYFAMETSVTKSGVESLENYTRVYAFNGAASETVTNTRNDNICRVNKEEFTTLNDAVKYITDNNLTVATVEMLQDYVIPENDAVTFPAGYDITLTTASDVDGLTTAVLYRGFSVALDMIAVEGSLTISNLTLDGKVPSNNGRSGNSGNGGLVTVKPGAVLTVQEGATFQNGQAANGSAIFAEDGTETAPTRVVFTGGTVRNNYATNGGAVGVGGLNTRIELSSDVTIYNNHRTNNGNQFNLYLNQDSDEIIQVTDTGLGSNAHIGVYVTGGTNEGDPWKEHGRPAKPFATFADGAGDNLDVFTSDRFTGNGVELNRGHASTLSDYADKVVWGETFSFTVDIQWLNADYQQIPAPDDASVNLSLRLPAGSTTREDGYHTATVTGKTYTFDGLARYNTNGTPCEYAVSETSVSPEDYAQIFFYGDLGVSTSNGSSTSYEVSGVYKGEKYKNNLVYSAAAGDGQHVVVSNRYKYTTFTVTKIVTALPEGYEVLHSGFTLMQVPKYGVGSANDLPNGLRSMDAPEAWENVATMQSGVVVTLAPTTHFFTLYGGNHWYCQVESVTATAEEMQAGIDGYAASGKGLVKFNSYHDTTRETDFADWQRGDVKYDGETYTVYDGSEWYPLDYSRDAQRPDVAIHYTHQDGDDGVESAGDAYGATSAGKTCTITTTGDEEATYTFEITENLASDYIYYAKETSTNLPDGTSISGSDKLIAAYNPTYEYDQVNRKVTVTNTWRSILTVEKKWEGDANQGICIFDLYKLTNTDGSALSRGILTDPEIFKELVEKGENANLSGITVTKLDGSFSLRDDDTDGREGSWVHAVTEEELGDTYDPTSVYFARERTVNGLPVSKHAVADENNPDARYEYHEETNLLVVTNLGAILCKVVDDDGTENVFRTLKEAYIYGTTKRVGSQDEFTIEMLRDYDYPNDDNLTIEAGKKVTLTTASTVQSESCNYIYIPPQTDPGKTRATITRGTKSGSFITVKGEDANSASLTLENIAFVGNGVEVNGHGGFVNASYTNISLNGTSPDNGVLMKGGAVSGNNRYGAAIYAENSETTLTYASFEECKANGANNHGGAIYITNKPLIINHSEFKKCEAKTNGGAIYSNGSIIEITDSYFEECKSLQTYNNSYGGGAIYTNAVLTINTSSFKNCTAKAVGGAIWSNKNVNIIGTASSRCVFDGCQAYKGGSVFMTGDLVGEFRYADFLESKATNGEGGAILQYKDNGQGQPNTSTTIDNCYFYKCTAPGSSDSSGGALQTNMRSLTVTNSKFEECSVGAKQGGAIQHYLGGKVEASTAIFENVDFIHCVAEGGNQSRAYGGGFSTDAYTVTVDNCRFTECSAVLGGAFSNCSNNNSNKDGSLTVQNCVFTSCNTLDNKSWINGGAIYATKKDVTITDATFKNCETKGEGGGIYQLYDNNAVNSSLTLIDCVFDTCKTKGASKNGGGIRTNAALVTVAGTTFKDCTAIYNGGGLYQTNTNNAARLIVTSNGSKASSFTNCTSTNGSGGGIYTQAKYVGATDGTDRQPIKADFTNCTAVNGNGGGMCVDYNGVSVVVLEDCSFNGCIAKNYGGGIHSNGLTLTANSCAFTDCEVLANTDGNSGGGGMYTSNGNAGSMTWLKGCTFEGCISSRNGGGLLTANRTLTIGKDGDMPTTFTGCQANNGQGGAIRQNQNTTDSSATLTECVIASCTASSNGGGLSTGVKTVQLSKSTFTDCTAGGAGGGLHSTYSGEGGSATLQGCVFTNCETSSDDGGGAVYCATRALTAEDYVEGETSISNTFTNCEAKGPGGGIRHNQSNGTKTKLTNCTFTACVSTGSDGGAVLTNVKALDMENCTVSDCHASTWGGGVNHSNSSAGTTTEVTGGSFENCYVEKNEGGGLRSSARSATLTEVTFTNCHSDGTAGDSGGGGFSFGSNDDYGTAAVSGCTFTGCYCNEGKNGGAILFKTKTLTVEGTTIDGTTSAAGVSYSADNGGGIYSSRGEVEIKAKTVEIDGEQTIIRSEIKNCMARTKGGGLYQAGSKKATVENSDITGNSAGTSGGGIYYYPKNTLTLDGCTVSGNSAGSSGGGVYYDSNDNSYADAKRLVMKNGTAITGNILTSGAVANGAGVYLRDGTTLVLGSADDESDEDILTIFGNTAGDGASNLRMLVQKLGTDPKQRNMISADHPDILLYSNLKLSEDKSLGWIGVCTPGEAGTQFGLADVLNRTNMAYFVSDDGILTGKLDEGDSRKIIWYAPPVCQITDANGKLLSYGPDHVEATFSSLKAAYEAFNTLADDYFKDGIENVTPVQIQMLVSRYSLNEELPALNRSGTLTTEANTPTCTIIRDAELTGSMFKVSPGIEMNVARITLDGGSEEKDDKGETLLVSKSNGGIIWADQLSLLVLGQNAQLLNSATSENGGAVYLSGGATMEMKFNSVIRDCSAGKNGGAIYVGSGASVTTTESPTVEGCHAAGSGGAMYVYDSATVNLGTTTDVWPTIANNSSDGDGAGIYLFGTRSKLNMQGKIDFTDNYKQEAIQETNGGEDYTKPRQDIYLQYNNTSAASNINVTGEIVADAGSIWVWAYNRSHYLLDMQFAVIQSGVTVSDETLKIFRDAVDDTTAENKMKEYYTGVRGKDVSYIYWGVSGLDFSFRKIDGFGNLLSNAQFTLYEDINCSTPLEKDGPVTAKSSDGIVLFEKVPVGVYYMQETSVPDGYQNALTRDADHKPVPNTYVVLIGSAELEGVSNRTGLWAQNELLEQITEEDLSKQIAIEGETDDRQYAIFLIDLETSKAVADPDIARYGIMNTSTDECKAILRKVNSSKASLEGAEFEILRYDKTKVSGTDAEGKTVTTFTSGVSGVYFIDMLPYGTYYLHEKTVPGSVTQNDEGWWYTLTVNEKGVQCSEQSATEPGTTQTP